MATSSIIDHIVVHNPRALEEWVKALDEAADKYQPQTEEERSNVCTDPDITRQFMEKALAKIGIHL